MGIFIHRDVFGEAGGYREIQILEEAELNERPAYSFGFPPGFLKRFC